MSSESRLAAKTLVEFAAPTSLREPVAPPAPASIDPRASMAKTMLQSAAPEHAPPSAQPRPESPAAGSGKQTMIGMPAADLLANVPRAAPAAQTAPQPAPAPVHDKRKGMASTMLGVAMPGIAPIAPGAPEPPPSQARPATTGPVGSGTILGVAIPGIAPLKPGFAQTQALAPQGGMPVGAPARPLNVEPIVPMPAPFVDEPLPQAPSRRSKVGLPVAAVAGGIAALLAIAGIAVAVLWKSAPPISAAPKLDAQGRDVLHLTCESCKEGTVVELDGAKATFAAGEADLLVKTLSVGQNPFALSINRPGIGRDETVKIVVPVAFRVRADLSGVSAVPPVITVRVEASPETEVRVDGKPLSLDAQGHGAYPIDIRAETEGTSDDAKQVERKVPYAITTKGKTKPEKGEVTARVRVVPLHLDAPGQHAVIEGSSFVVAGQTIVGATLTINGDPVTLEANGTFAHTLQAAAVGEAPVEVATTAAGNARRTVNFKVKRVEHLDAEAKADDAGSLLRYDAIAADIAGKVGQPAVLDGEVVEARVSAHQTILLIADRRGCTATGEGACLARVVHGATDDGSPAAPIARGKHLALKRGDTVRAYGRVTRAVTTSAGKILPELEADFLIRPAR